MVKVEKVKFEGWNCIRVSGGGTDVYVTVDMGPRIIGLTHNGGKNHMAVFEDTKGKVIKSDKFVAYGGHQKPHLFQRQQPLRSRAVRRRVQGDGADREANDVAPRL